MQGSGVRVAAGIITNAHVVDGATTVQVTTSDGRSGSATVVRSDKDLDLALLQTNVELIAPPWAKAAAESKDRAARVKSALPNDEDEFTVSSLVKLFYVEPAGREKLRANGRMQPETLHATSLRLFTRVDFEDHVDLGAIIELAD